MTPIASERPVASLLTDLSRDVADMSQHASAIDSIANVIDVTSANDVQRQALQRVDELFQHLDDLAKILATIGKTVDPKVVVDPHFVANHVRLNYMKSRVLGAHIEQMNNIESGEVDLF